MEQPRPTLNIDDIVLLKSNPKEYYKKQLEKETITGQEIVKHPVTERIRNIGKTGKIGKDYQGEDGNIYYDLTYSDGTKITYKKAGATDVHIKEHSDRVLIKDPDNKYGEYEHWAEPFALTDALENAIFEQHPELSDSFYISDNPIRVNGGWEVPVTIQEYIHEGKTIDVISSVTTPDGEKISMLDNGKIFREHPGSAITDENRRYVNDKSEAFQSDEYGNYKRPTRNSFYRTDVEGRNWDGLEVDENGKTEFYNIVSNNKISDEVPSFITVKPRTLLPEGQGIDKGIFTNDDYYVGFNVLDNSNVKVQNTTRRSWTIITLQQQGNPARKGVQCGRNGDNDLFLTAPDAKFERRLIDEKNKIIIQTPYKPGMERHIWG